MKEVMNPGSSERRGLLLGWALGLFEAGVVLSGAGSLGDASIYLAVPVTNCCFYGILGWLAAMALGRKRQLPWTFLYFLGCLFLGFLCIRRGLPEMSGLGWTALGSVSSLVLFKFSLRPQLPRWLAGAGVLCCLTPGVFWLYFYGHRDQAKESVASRQTAPADAISVVLVTWDTVRADSLSLFGGGGVSTPALDQLAAEGLVFDDFLSVAPLTGPAHASILSGLTPPSHGLRANGEKSPQLEMPRLPEILHSAGWATGAFVAALPVHSQFGFAKGFQYFDDRSEATPTRRILQSWGYASSFARLFLPDLRGTRRMIRGETVLQRATEWMEQQTRPTFAWLHFFDAHAPYEPSSEMLAVAKKGADQGPHAFDPADEEALILQRGEIMALDSALGKLLEFLNDRDPGLEQTVILLLADHGECFGEGGIHQAHEPSLFEATQKVPAILRLPGSKGTRGDRSQVPATQVDVLPMLCAVLSLPLPEGVQGINILQPVDANRGRYMEAWQKRLRDQRLQGWVQGDWKYIRSQAGEEWLFRRGSADGNFLETDNWLIRDPARARAMSLALQRWWSSIPIRKAEEFDLDSATQATLQSLGYVDEEEE